MMLYETLGIVRRVSEVVGLGMRAKEEASTGPAGRTFRTQPLLHLHLFYLFSFHRGFHWKKGLHS